MSTIQYNTAVKIESSGIGHKTLHSSANDSAKNTAPNDAKNNAPDSVANAPIRRSLSRYYLISLALNLLVAAWLWTPAISANLPYMHDEDEAHHFNRIVRMVQSGDYNPHYFLKPSLHFYLRMPVVAVGFLWEVSQGRARVLKDIETKDPMGVGGYSFSASHPTVLKLNRYFSVLCCLLTIILVGSLVNSLTGGNLLLASLSCSLVAVSPALVGGATIVGVDVVVMLMATLTVWAANRFLSLSHVGDRSRGDTHVSLRHISLWPSIIACGLFAGLTASTKYNAALVALTPIAATVSSLRKDSDNYGVMIALSLLLPVLGFIIGSPYVISELPLFLDHLGYELWHYKIAGHAGHSAEPGWQQLKFYISWFITDGVGFTATLLGLFGLVSMFIVKPKRTFAIALFPIIYIGFMSLQKANFTRNMLVMIPFVAIGVGYFLSLVLRSKRYATISPKRRVIAAVLVTLAVILQPTYHALSLRGKVVAESVESRSAAQLWIERELSNTEKDLDVAIDPALQPSLRFQNLLHVSVLKNKILKDKADSQQIKYIEPYLSGYDLLVSNTLTSKESKESKAEAAPYFTEVQKFGESSDDSSGPKRIVRNPKISIFEARPVSDLVKDLLASSADTEIKANYRFPAELKALGVTRCTTSTENHCWTTGRLMFVDTSALALPSNTAVSAPLRLTIRGKTPWKGQNIAIVQGGSSPLELNFKQLANQSEFLNIEFTLDRKNLSQGFYIVTDRVRSPKNSGLSEDPRRLGIAIESIAIE
jgi:hypothetical protein